MGRVSLGIGVSGKPSIGITLRFLILLLVRKAFGVGRTGLLRLLVCLAHLQLIRVDVLDTDVVDAGSRPVPALDAAGADRLRAEHAERDALRVSWREVPDEPHAQRQSRCSMSRLWGQSSGKGWARARVPERLESD